MKPEHRYQLIIQSEQFEGALGDRVYWLMQWNRKTGKWVNVPDSSRPTKRQVQAFAKKHFGITGI